MGHKNYLAFLVKIIEKMLAIFREKIIMIYMNSNTKRIEQLGAGFGILGAFLAAAGFGIIGYPCFTLSSILLVYTSIMQKNYNLLSMQAAFLAANILGIFTFTV